MAKIRAAGTGGTINSLVVDWDPATNSDGSLYTSVRHYEVEFSKDNEKWYKAGTNQSTDHEIMDRLLEISQYLVVLITLEFT